MYFSLLQGVNESPNWNIFFHIRVLKLTTLYMHTISVISRQIADAEAVIYALVLFCPFSPLFFLYPSFLFLSLPPFLFTYLLLSCLCVLVMCLQLLLFLSTAIKLNVGMEISSLFLTIALLGGDRAVSCSGWFTYQIELLEQFWVLW